MRVVVCLLVRHAVHDLIDRVLVGRTAGVGLNDAGHRQASAVAEQLTSRRITRIQSSPRERALETARPIAKRLGLEIEVCNSIDEVEFGTWSGRGFEQLASEDAWRNWNEHRNSARAPGGESMCEAQARITAHIKSLQLAEPGATIVMVSHAEMIRAAALSCMSLPLDAWWRIEVPPASVTRIELRSGQRTLVSSGWGGVP